MLALHGTGAGKGIAIGRAYVLQRAGVEIPEYVLPKMYLKDEVARFKAGIANARVQLEDIRNHIPRNAPSEAASFIDTHLLILDDKMLSREPIDTIQKQGYNAEWALKVHSEALMTVFEQMEDPYFRSKKTDVEQVVDRIQRNLLDIQESSHEEVDDALDGSIVITDDVSPADTVMLKHRSVGAFVTDFGGPISHTAILARGLRIPAIVGLHGAARYIRNGDELIVDGKRGVLIIGPDKQTLKEYRQRIRRIAVLRQELHAIRKSPSVTIDRQRITLLANIELPDEIRSAKKVAAAGVGLYRTEFLYMNRDDLPTESEQLSAYMRVVKSMGRSPVTIRTVDIGADKQVNGRAEKRGMNPALGLRAVRLCLHDPTIFRPQLRAIYRASAHGRVQLMIPMISSVDELHQVLEMIRETKSELKREGRAFSTRVPIGGMIEVPAAAVAADLFAEHLDFLSIGTNDLIQYTLAIDRVDDSVNYLYDPLHPSVLRLIQMTIDAGERAGIPVTMCGEMAGDIRYTRLLLGMGLRAFSMDPTLLPEIKKVIRESEIQRLMRQAKKVLRATDRAEVQAILNKINTTPHH